MTAKVLIVDDIDFNVKLLETKLKHEYYQTFSAFDGKQAIERAKQVDPDIILMDIMMPVMNGFDATREIKNDPELSHIPIIMVTALNAQEDKVKGLQAGADDFLTKPINDHALMSRLKSLVRLKTLTDELKLRDKGLQSSEDPEAVMKRRNNIEGTNILLIDDDALQIKKIKDKLVENNINVDSVEDPAQALQLGGQKAYNAVVVSTMLLKADGLGIVAELRSNEKFKHTPMLIVVDENDEMTINKGMDMGVNDFLISPLDMNEFFARTCTQIRRKNYQDELKTNIAHVVEQSTHDSLTGLHNRNFLDVHYKDMVKQALANNKPLSIAMVDIDHFKNINDTHGHQAGDAVLTELGKRLTFNLRESDFCARYGGEEFLVIMPDTTQLGARLVGERIKLITSDLPFQVPAKEGNISCTVSVGIASLRPNETAQELQARADKALYKAKNEGRNRVVEDQE